MDLISIVEIAMLALSCTHCQGKDDFNRLRILRNTILAIHLRCRQICIYLYGGRILHVNCVAPMILGN